MTERYRNNTPDFQTHPVFAVAEFFLRNVIHIYNHFEDINRRRSELHRLIHWLENQKSITDAVRTGLDRLLRREIAPRDVNKYLNGFFSFSYENSRTLYIEITARPSDLDDLSRPNGFSLLNERLQELRNAFYEEESFDNREQNHRDPSPELSEPTPSHAEQMAILLNNAAVNVGPARVIRPASNRLSRRDLDRNAASETRPKPTSSSGPAQPPTRKMDARRREPSTTTFHQLPRVPQSENSKELCEKKFNATLCSNNTSEKVSHEQTSLSNTSFETAGPTVPITPVHLQPSLSKRSTETIVAALAKSSMSELSVHETSICSNDKLSTVSKTDIQITRVKLSAASQPIMHSPLNVSTSLAQFSAEPIRKQPEKKGFLETLSMSPQKQALSSAVSGGMPFHSFRPYPDQQAKVTDEFKSSTFYSSSLHTPTITTSGRQSCFVSTEKRILTGQVATSMISIEPLDWIPEVKKRKSALLPKSIGPLVFQLNETGEIVPATATNALTEDLSFNHFSSEKLPSQSPGCKKKKPNGICGRCGGTIYSSHKIRQCRCLLDRIRPMVTVLRRLPEISLLIQERFVGLGGRLHFILTRRIMQLIVT
ncbi:hypothetical protein CRE_27515 [Caenorhabditis remanei]|uniref:Uncharacterized protein n=1 Tax=Caenorhabditis remanei TaxID=31234 RepID=E3LP14_CAERE|nr:hypothetical protein CRE_27515 [Caenorhabditis remanei]